MFSAIKCYLEKFITLRQTSIVLISFFVLFLLGWFSNALFDTKYDTKELREFFTWIGVYVNANHGINSIFNSPKGEMPVSK